jgi:hypothetical protein
LTRLLNETKDGDLLDRHVVKPSDLLQESNDDNGSEDITSDKIEKEGQKNETVKIEKEGPKHKTAKVVFGYIQLLRQIENHFYLVEPFLRENLEEGELQCIEEALTRMVDVKSLPNEEGLLNLRYQLAEMHRPQNGDQQKNDGSKYNRSAEPPDSSVTDSNVGMAHGSLCFYV